ncbi:MAG TPA: hypothetical protein VN132_15700 [Bdellovibrio sp.]|nr:hypothetical protein [Bdellovibrio sp.]
MIYRHDVKTGNNLLVDEFIYSGYHGYAGSISNDTENFFQSSCTGN